MCVDSFFTEKARTHTRPLRIARHGRWLCRIMPPSVPFISACRAVYPIGQRRSSSQHFRFQSEALVYGDEIGNVFFTQPFEERPTKARDRHDDAASHAACNIARGMCSRRRGTACAMHGRCHGASCAGRDSARTASSSISYTPTGLPRLAAPFLCARAPDSPRTVMRRNASHCNALGHCGEASVRRGDGSAR